METGYVVTGYTERGGLKTLNVNRFESPDGITLKTRTDKKRFYRFNNKFEDESQILINSPELVKKLNSGEEVFLKKENM